MLEIKRSTTLILTVFILCFFSSCRQDGEPKGTSPFSPEEALKTFKLPKGFKIQLVASEPLVKDPTEIAFDEKGQMYVAQMEDYPGENEPTGKIMLLVDEDGDGFYEKGTVFADNLPYVNGVMPWKGGVLVTSAPDIYFLKDTTGDGVADIREVVLTGFAFTNPQLRMSSLRYGLDNWVYGAYSRAGGGTWYTEFKDNKGSALKFLQAQDKQLPEIYPGTDYRFKPNEHIIEPSGGMSQFGLSFDASGNRFTVWNNIHMRHVVLENRYRKNNPYLTIASDMNNISDHGDAAQVFSSAKNMLDLHESEIGHFTSACGNLVYTGGLSFEAYQSAGFVCEPVSNIVHADKLSVEGASFIASRIQDKEEFLSSTDSWFRPVNLTLGPDGGLYVVDFYRKLVEHPDWISMADEEGFHTHAGVLTKADFAEGTDKGRIYRIVPDNFQYDYSKKINLSDESDENLVGNLASANMWLRINSQRMLVDCGNLQSVDLLIQSLKKSQSAESYIHHLWTLDGLNALDDSFVISGLNHTDPNVKRQALIMAEQRIDKKPIYNVIVDKLKDESPVVRFQALLTLGTTGFKTAEALAFIGESMKTNFNDPWFRYAALLNVNAMQSPVAWFEAFSKGALDTKEQEEGRRQFVGQLTSVVGAKGNDKEVSDLISAISALNRDDSGMLSASLSGLTDGLNRHNRAFRLSKETEGAFMSLLSFEQPEVLSKAVALAYHLTLSNSIELKRLLEEARNVVANEQTDVDQRILGLQLLGLAKSDFPFSTLSKVLSVNQPSAFQAAVLNVLLKNGSEQSDQLIINNWNMLSASNRDLVETAFLRTPKRINLLLEEVSNERVKKSWISRNMQNRLLQHSDGNIKEKAAQLFTASKSADRNKIIETYYSSTHSKGDPTKGKALFKTACSSCHVLEGVGSNYGPDLLSVSHQTKITLLTMILHPNNNLAPGYEGYLVETNDGRTLAGIISSEDEAGIVLRGPDGKEQTLVRSQIKAATPMSDSLMPEGLETSISVDEMTDLLEYLKTVSK